MQEQLISFETAKLAKAKKFGYDFGGTHYVPGFYCDEEFDKDPEEFEMQQEDACRCDYYLRPTQSLLQKWLREVHNIEVYVLPHTRYKIEGKFYEVIVDKMMITWSGNKTYEKALEIGLKKGLKLIK